MRFRFNAQGPGIPRSPVSLSDRVKKREKHLKGAGQLTGPANSLKTRQYFQNVRPSI